MHWNKMKNMICIGLVFLWIDVIFSFSLQPAYSSEQTSSGVVLTVIETLSTILGDDAQKFFLERIDLLHHIIRKCAHFTEYYILGILVILSLNNMYLENKLVYGSVFCVLIAFIDETIQRFVPGRSSQIADVMLDSAGALVGIVFCCFINNCLKHRKNNIKIS